MATAFDVDPRIHIFNAYAEFEPTWTIKHFRPSIRQRERMYRRLVRYCRRYLRWVINAEVSYDYARIWRAMGNRPLPPNHYPGGFADWDNTARRGKNPTMVIRNFDKQAFVDGIAAQVSKARRTGAEFLFFNAWNEWAEGTYLEPDEQRGLFFLEAIRRALDSPQD
jgi:hypothetical protein